MTSGQEVVKAVEGLGSQSGKTKGKITITKCVQRSLSDASDALQVGRVLNAFRACPSVTRSASSLHDHVRAFSELPASL